MVISPVNVSGTVIKPGQLVPADWPVMRLRRLHRSQQIGPIGSDWTELMIRSWEDTVLARALAPLEPKERELRAAEWGAELEQRRASRASTLDAALAEERRAAEQSRREAQGRRDRRAAEAKEREDAERLAREAAAAERAAEIERVRAEELARAEAERLLASEPSESQRAALGALAAAHLPPPAEPTNDSAPAEDGDPSGEAPE